MATAPRGTSNWAESHQGAVGWACGWAISPPTSSRTTPTYDARRHARERPGEHQRHPNECEFAHIRDQRIHGMLLPSFVASTGAWGTRCRYMRPSTFVRSRRSVIRPCAYRKRQLTFGDLLIYVNVRLRSGSHAMFAARRLRSPTPLKQRGGRSRLFCSDAPSPSRVRLGGKRRFSVLRPTARAARCFGMRRAPVPALGLPIARAQARGSGSSAASCGP
jgi:hypothetical protein